MLFVVQRCDGKPHDLVRAANACTEGSRVVFSDLDNPSVATVPVAGIRKTIAVTRTQDPKTALS